MVISSNWTVRKAYTAIKTNGIKKCKNPAISRAKTIRNAIIKKFVIDQSRTVAGASRLSG